MQFLSSELGHYFYKSTIWPCQEYCCHVSDGPHSCYLDMLDKLQKKSVWDCWSFTWLLNFWLIFEIYPAEIFLEVCFSRTSSELAELVPLFHSQERSSRNSSRLHGFSINIPRYQDVYVSSFITCTATLWHFLPPECFLLTLRSKWTQS